MQMKFKPGMVVRMVSYDPYDITGPLKHVFDSSPTAPEGIVLGSSKEYDARDNVYEWVQVQFPFYFEGHSGHGLGRDGYCWGIKSDHLVILGENYGREDDV